MLVLSREKNESIVINDDITIVVVEIRGDKVRLGLRPQRKYPSTAARSSMPSAATKPRWAKKETEKIDEAKTQGEPLEIRPARTASDPRFFCRWPPLSRCSPRRRVSMDLRDSRRSLPAAKDSRDRPPLPLREVPHGAGFAGAGRSLLPEGT